MLGVTSWTYTSQLGSAVMYQAIGFLASLAVVTVIAILLDAFGNPAPKIVFLYFLT